MFSAPFSDAFRSQSCRRYFNIVRELGRMTTYRHEKTETQYAVFDSGDRGLVSYDDPRAICDKVAYANERGMAGCE